MTAIRTILSNTNITQEGDSKLPDQDAFIELSLEAWSTALNSIFPNGIPGSTSWSDPKRIAAVLDIVGRSDQSNHLYYPTFGGNDLLGATVLKEEPDCVALRTGNRAYELVKPATLMFESNGPDLQWAYFRLECSPMLPTGVYESGYEGKREEVVLIDGEYAPRSAWDDDEFRGRPLPQSAKLIIRSITGEPFVIFAKGSVYNFARGNGFDAYNAPHAKMSADEFRAFIKRNAEAKNK